MTALSEGIEECDAWAKSGGHVPPLLSQAWTSSVRAAKEGWANSPGVPFQAGNPWTLKPASSQVTFCLPGRALSSSFRRPCHFRRVRSLTSWFPKCPQHPGCGLAGVVTADSVLWNQDARAWSSHYQTSLMCCNVGRGRHRLSDPSP